MLWKPLDFIQSLPSFVLICSHGSPQTHCNVVFTLALAMMTVCQLTSSCSPSYSVCSHHISGVFFQPYHGSHMINKIYWYNLSPKKKVLFRLLLILLLDFCFSIINCMKGRIKSYTVFNHKCESVANAKPLTSHLIQQFL